MNLVLPNNGNQDDNIATRIAVGPRQINFPDPLDHLPQAAVAPTQTTTPRVRTETDKAAPPSDKLKAYRPKIICVRNNKGGVAKTTVAYTLSWALAKEGKHVFMVVCRCSCAQRKMSCLVARVIYH